MWKIDHILPSLFGTWQFVRTVADYADMVGAAQFNAMDDGAVLYRETGVMTLPQGARQDFYKTYIYKPYPRGFSVYFDEVVPRLFHHVILDEHFVGRAQHICAADTYDTTYQFNSDGTFLVTHGVTGPRKNYVSHTQFIQNVRHKKT